MLPSFLLLCALLQASCYPLHAQQTGVLGYWREPGGSVIHVETCGTIVCAVLTSISPTAPGRIDIHNPDKNLRDRSLCGVRIGEGFQLSGPTTAEGGKLYDPKSGRTYSARMESNGDELALRGYVGFSMLGRTEKWNRTSPVNTCQR
jgi:uncharacterized protein (DUF2147 family)